MKNKKGLVFYNRILAGYLRKANQKYYFQYRKEYLEDEKNPAISLSFPKQIQEYESDYLFPFFYGLLAEGDNKQLQCRTLHIDEKDNFTRLIKTAGIDTIGAITVKEEE